MTKPTSFLVKGVMIHRFVDEMDIKVVAGTENGLDILTGVYDRSEDEAHNFLSQAIALESLNRDTSCIVYDHHVSGNFHIDTSIQTLADYVYYLTTNNKPFAEESRLAM